MSNNEDPRLSGPLADLRNTGDGFRTPPPAYFDDLAERVLHDAAQRPAVIRRLYQPWMAIAAALLLLLVAGFLLWPVATATDGDLVAGNPQPATDHRPLTTDEILAEIDPADIEAYISADLDNFESELYADN
jgi:hypothetical protein